MEKTLGERCLDVAMDQLGVKEEPPRSNSGPKVREFLSPCVRGDKNVRLGLKASNWCMAFVSWCMQEALRSTEKVPHGYRAGVVEAIADVRDTDGKWSGKWHDVKEVRDGSWVPKPGDLAIYDRSVPGKPETSWWRHVNRVVSFNSDEGTFITIGGNERDQVRIGEESISGGRIIGFIAYPQPKEIVTKELLSPEEKNKIKLLMHETIDGIIRDSVWESYGDDVN